MNNYNEGFLAKKYTSILFGDIYKDGIYFGFECGDGWLGLVDGILGFFAKHAEGNHLKLRVTQVKGKFGQLRIYNRGGDDVIRTAADMGELISRSLCECCGRVGTVANEGGWIVTRCDDHFRGINCEQFRMDPEEFEAYSALCTVAIAAMLSLFCSDAVRWAQTPSAALHGLRPFEVLGTKIGCQEIILLIKRLEYGVEV